MAGLKIRFRFAACLMASPGTMHQDGEAYISFSGLKQDFLGVANTIKLCLESVFERRTNPC
jgi:hypothetical protein